MGSMAKSHVLSCPDNFLWSNVPCAPLTGFWASCTEQLVAVSRHSCPDFRSQEQLCVHEKMLFTFLDVYHSLLLSVSLWRR